MLVIRPSLQSAFQFTSGVGVGVGLGSVQASQALTHKTGEAISALEANNCL